MSDLEKDTKKDTNEENIKEEPNSSLAEDNKELSVDEIQERLEIAEKAVSDNWDKFLKAKADADNIQKRAIKDIESAHKYALEKFVPELLSVKDSLEASIKLAADNSEMDIKSFVEGNKMTVKMFSDTLEKFKIIEINPAKEEFNPEYHQAITMLPSEDVAPNTVIEVIQKGYMLNERLVRPALVVVSQSK